MLAGEIYTARSAAGKSIDGNARTDVVPSTIKRPREEGAKKLATANAAVVSSLPIVAANSPVLPILPHRMIPQRRTPARHRSPIVRQLRRHHRPAGNHRPNSKPRRRTSPKKIPTRHPPPLQFLDTFLSLHSTNNHRMDPPPKMATAVSDEK